MLVQWRVDCLKVIPVITERERINDPVLAANETAEEQRAKESLLANLAIPKNIVLLTGVNEVDDKSWELARGGVQDELDREHLVELNFRTRPAPGKPVRTARKFIELEANDAVGKILPVVFNPDNLFAWKDAETRDEVRAAITKRIEELGISQKVTEKRESKDPKADLRVDSGAGKRQEAVLAQKVGEGESDPKDTKTQEKV